MGSNDKSNDKKRSYAWIFTEIVACLFLWVVLIVLKAVGYIDMHWALVLSGIVWISWLWCAVSALLVLAIHGLACLKRWHRRRKNDRRIIRQAKAAGVWEKPQCLGGRALELKAWKLYKIRRKSGETDKELRQRCMTAADNEYADAIVKVFDNETKERRKK